MLQKLMLGQIIMRHQHYTAAHLSEPDNNLCQPFNVSELGESSHQKHVIYMKSTTPNRTHSDDLLAKIYIRD